MTRQRKWQIEMEKLGKCRTCGEPGVLKENGSVSPYCIIHLIYVRENARRLHGYKKRANSLSYRLTSTAKPDYKVDYKVDYP